MNFLKHSTFSLVILVCLVVAGCESSKTVITNSTTGTAVPTPRRPSKPEVKSAPPIPKLQAGEDVAVLDELGKIIAAGGLSPAFVTLLNELRHRLLWLLISCQLPSELPEKIIGLCNGIFAGRTESEAGHRTLCAAKPGYTEVSREVLARLPPGTFATCFGDASDKALAGRAFLLKVRDTCATPGGQTKSSSATPADGEDPEDK